MKTKSLQVLIADDHPGVLDSMVMLLELEGFDVRSCRNGKEALELCMRYKPDVVVLDIDMPVMNGHAAARAIRSTPEIRGTRLVALTGRPAWADHDNAIAAGFDLFLSKPVPVEVLLTALRDPLPTESAPSTRIAA